MRDNAELRYEKTEQERGMDLTLFLILEEHDG